VDKVKAHAEDGVLTVVLQKPNRPNPDRSPSRAHNFIERGTRHDRERNQILQAKGKKEVTTPAELTKPDWFLIPQLTF